MRWQRQRVRSHELTNHSPYNIEGAKILVIGYGNCGKAIAKKLRGLG